MQIAAGKTYPTREGGTAQIVEIHEDEAMYQIRGVCVEKSGARRLAFWMASGRYNASALSQFDLLPGVH